MTKTERETKIKWFKLRTGCADEEAKKWLFESKWRIEVAIRLRNASFVKPN